MLDENTALSLGPLAVGAVLVAAGMSKFLAQASFRNALAASYDIRGHWQTTMAAGLPAMEVLLGVLLITGSYANLVSPAAVLFLGAITVVLVFRLTDGADCACGLPSFGRSTFAVAARNLAFIAVLLPAAVTQGTGLSDPAGNELLRGGTPLLLALPLLLWAGGFSMLSTAPSRLSRRSLLRLAAASALIFVAGARNSRTAEAACYGCKTCSPQSVLVGCSEACCTYLVRDREYCDSGCSPCSGWRQVVFC